GARPGFGRPPAPVGAGPAPRRPRATRPGRRAAVGGRRGGGLRRLGLQDLGGGADGLDLARGHVRADRVGDARATPPARPGGAGGGCGAGGRGAGAPGPGEGRSRRPAGVRGAALVGCPPGVGGTTGPPGRRRLGRSRRGAPAPRGQLARVGQVVVPVVGAPPGRGLAVAGRPAAAPPGLAGRGCTGVPRRAPAAGPAGAGIGRRPAAPPAAELLLPRRRRPVAGGPARRGVAPGVGRGRAPAPAPPVALGTGAGGPLGSGAIARPPPGRRSLRRAQGRSSRIAATSAGAPSAASRPGWPRLIGRARLPTPTPGLSIDDSVADGPGGLVDGPGTGGGTRDRDR